MKTKTIMLVALLGFLGIFVGESMQVSSNMIPGIGVMEHKQAACNISPNQQTGTYNAAGCATAFNNIPQKALVCPLSRSKVSLKGCSVNSDACTASTTSGQATGMWCTCTYECVYGS
ncbi:MAG: hypothetical protein AABW64_03445 [Nanoarchaeota archaeon]